MKSNDPFNFSRNVNKNHQNILIGRICKQKLFNLFSNDVETRSSLLQVYTKHIPRKRAWYKYPSAQPLNFNDGTVTLLVLVNQMK